MKYFEKGRYNKAKLKAQYKTLAKIHHPDRGGSNEAFQEMNQEYLSILERFKKGSHKQSDSQWKQEQKADLDSLLKSMGLSNPIYRGMAKQALKMGGDFMLQFLQKKLK